MSISIHIHPRHRQHTDGRKIIEAKGNRVGPVLKDVIDRYPGIKKEWFNPKGELHHYIEIYLNGESAYPGELTKEVNDGDEIQLITFLAGG